MEGIQNHRRLCDLALGAMLAMLAPLAQAADAEAAQQALEANKCVKCHAVDRKKDGPAYRDVAAKFKSESDAEAQLRHHLTAGDKVKFPDGHEERHKSMKSRDPAEVDNLIHWILSLDGGTKY
jgi:cytochrome c